MRNRSSRKQPPPPLKSSDFRDLAVNYVGRYATTKAKLSAYLARKLRERGWDGDRPPDIEALVNELATLHYIDDAGFAEARARSFVRRGYGKRRLDQDLFAAGVGDADAQGADDHMSESRFEAAENFARRKRIGPFANETASPEKREKQLAAFIRAGHDFGIARKFVGADPGDIVSED